MFVVGGENLIDFIQFDAGDGGHPAYRAIPGGAPFNVAKAVCRQGVTTGYVTPFSQDSLGQLLRGDLLRDPVTVLSPDSPKPTSLAVVSLKAGHATYQFYRDGTAERDVTAPALLSRLPPETKGFFIGSLAVTDGADALAWTEVFHDVSRRGLFSVLDPNIRAAFIHDRTAYLKRLDSLLAAASLVKLSDEDMAWIAPGTDPREGAAQMFAKSGAGMLVVTLGSKGAHAITHNARIDVPPHPVPDLKDTVGAGDTFMGTLIAQCMRLGLGSRDALAAASEDLLRRILGTAAEAAAINCGRIGCDPPTLADLGLA